jgi:hypothetical protein
MQAIRVIRCKSKGPIGDGESMSVVTHVQQAKPSNESRVDCLLGDNSDGSGYITCASVPQRKEVENLVVHWIRLFSATACALATAKAMMKRAKVKSVGEASSSLFLPMNVQAKHGERRLFMMLAMLVEFGGILKVDMCHSAYVTSTLSIKG